MKRSAMVEWLIEQLGDSAVSCRKFVSLIPGSDTRRLENSPCQPIGTCFESGARGPPVFFLFFCCCCFVVDGI